jgi:transposase
MTKRRKFSDQFKAKVALEALRGDRTIQEIAAKHRLHPTQISTWKKKAVEGLSGVFLKAENLRVQVNPRSRTYMPKSGGWQWRTIF